MRARAHARLVRRRAAEARTTSTPRAPQLPPLRTTASSLRDAWVQPLAMQHSAWQRAMHAARLAQPAEKPVMGFSMLMMAYTPTPPSTMELLPSSFSASTWWRRRE